MTTAVIAVASPSGAQDPEPRAARELLTAVRYLFFVSSCAF
jgi:hypothetical protein